MKPEQKCKREAVETLGYDDVVSTFHDSWAEFVGAAHALEEAWLILPDWVPALPKRFADSSRFRGWWRSDDERTELCMSDPYWYRDLPEAHYRVDSWELRRRAGGQFEFKLWPQKFCKPGSWDTDPEAPVRAVNWHRKMVRAQQDDAYRRFASVALGEAAYG